MHPLPVRYRAGRLPKTGRQMSNNHATKKLLRYWPSRQCIRWSEGIRYLFTIPGNLFSQGFFVLARLAKTTPTLCFVLLRQIIQNETVGVNSARLAPITPTADATPPRRGEYFRRPPTMKFFVILFAALSALILNGSAVAQETEVEQPSKEVSAESKAVKTADKGKAVDIKETKKQEVLLQEPEIGKELKERKTFRGDVSGISSNFLAIETSVNARAAQEMAFTVSKDVKIIGKEKILDIKNGDTVNVLAEETTQSVKTKDKNGKESREVKTLSRVVTEITVIKAAPQPEPEVKPAAESEEAEEEPVTEDASLEEEAGE